jgi:hypothetical protein
MNTTRPVRAGLERFFIEDVSAREIFCWCIPTCRHQEIAFFKLLADT